MRTTSEKIQKAFSRFIVPKEELDYEGTPKLKECKLCGGEAAIFENTHFAAFCLNPECDRSLLGSYNPCWRTNCTKAALDWNEQGLEETNDDLDKGETK